MTYVKAEEGNTFTKNDRQFVFLMIANDTLKIFSVGSYNRYSDVEYRLFQMVDIDALFNTK